MTLPELVAILDVLDTHLAAGARLVVTAEEHVPGGGAPSRLVLIRGHAARRAGLGHGAAPTPAEGRRP